MCSAPMAFWYIPVMMLARAGEQTPAVMQALS